MAEGQPRTLEVLRDQDGHRFVVTGDVPITSTVRPDYVAGSDPARFTGEAFRRVLGEEGIAVLGGTRATTDSLDFLVVITNGGFENEKMLGGGFDWKIADVKGAKVAFDRSIAFEGNRSIKITFDGKENVDFHHVQQMVSLKPNTDYSLKAYIRTKEVSTKSGFKIEVYGIGSTFHGSSESVVGENAWKELSVTFRTTPQSQAGVVRLRREKTDKFVG